MSLTPEFLASLKTIEDCEQAIEDRHRLISQMVGQLYPSILRAEIHEIAVRKGEIYHNQHGVK